MSFCGVKKAPNSPTWVQADSLSLKSLDDSTANTTALLAISHKEKEDDIRQQRMSEALNSLHSRLDACQNSLKVETLIAKEAMVRFGKVEKRFSKLALGSSGICSLIGVFIEGHVFTGIICGVFLLLCSVWFRQSSKDKAAVADETLQALNAIITRLGDVDTGVDKCERLLAESLESDGDWMRQEEQDRQRWEEERDRTEQEQNNRVNARFKTLHPELLAVKASVRPPRLKKQPLRKERSMLRSKSFRGFLSSFREHKDVSLTSSTLSPYDSSMPEPPFHFSATKSWRDYVDLNLPLERMGEMTEAERAFSKQMREATKDLWEELDMDLKLMALRAWEGKKDRLGFTSEQVEYIVNWRRECNADKMLDEMGDKADERFFGAWLTRFGGQDIYGHPVIYDRVEDFDLDYLFTLSDKEVLSCHTKQMEVLRQKKKDIGIGRRQRVCKHVYVLDLKGLSLNKHFTSRMKNLLGSIFKVEGTAYPDSLWSLWLINTPMVFKLIWSALSPGIDPASKAKIRMKGGPADYLPEMERCGIPPSAVPRELGGEHIRVTYWEALTEIVELRNKKKV